MISFRCVFFGIPKKTKYKLHFWIFFNREAPLKVFRSLDDWLTMTRKIQTICTDYTKSNDRLFIYWSEKGVLPLISYRYMGISIDTAWILPTNKRLLTQQQQHFAPNINLVIKFADFYRSFRPCLPLTCKKKPFIGCVLSMFIHNTSSA